MPLYSALYSAKSLQPALQRTDISDARSHAYIGAQTRRRVHAASYSTRPTIASGSAAPPSPNPRGRRDLVGTPRRHDRRTAESDKVVGPVAVLQPRGRSEAAQTARAAGCLDKRRPDHLGGVERRLSCKSAPARRRARLGDVGSQGAAVRGQRTSRAARSATDRRDRGCSCPAAPRARPRTNERRHLPPRPPRAGRSNTALQQKASV